MSASDSHPPVRLFFSSSAQGRTGLLWSMLDDECSNLAYSNLPVLRATSDIPSGVSIDVGYVLSVFVTGRPSTPMKAPTENRMRTYVLWPHVYADANAELEYSDDSDAMRVTIRTTTPIEVGAMVCIARPTDKRVIEMSRTSRLLSALPLLMSHPSIEKELRWWFMRSLTASRDAINTTTTTTTATVTKRNDHEPGFESAVCCVDASIHSQLILFRFARNELNVPPSYPFTVLSRLWPHVAQSHRVGGRKPQLDRSESIDEYAFIYSRRDEAWNARLIGAAVYEREDARRQEDVTHRALACPQPSPISVTTPAPLSPRSAAFQLLTDLVRRDYTLPARHLKH